MKAIPPKPTAEPKVGKFLRVLSDAEALCYFKNYPETEKTYAGQGIPLNSTSASYSWNGYATNNEQRNVFCKDPDGKYNVTLT